MVSSCEVIHSKGYTVQQGFAASPCERLPEAEQRRCRSPRCKEIGTLAIPNAGRDVTRFVRTPRLDGWESIAADVLPRAARRELRYGAAAPTPRRCCRAVRGTLASNSPSAPRNYWPLTTTCCTGLRHGRCCGTDLPARLHRPGPPRLSPSPSPPSRRRLACWLYCPYSGPHPPGAHSALRRR